MKNNLFIITENLSNGVIQSQVLSHIIFLKKKKICNFILLVCYWTEDQIKSSKNLSLKLEKRIDSKIFFLKLLPPKLIFSDFINKKRITNFILKKDFKINYIHARTDFCAIIASDLKRKINARLIWDCRGYAPAEIDYNENKSINFIKKFLLEKRFINACKVSDKVIVVSIFLRNKIQKIKKNNIFVIPSVASSSLFNFNKEKRKIMRKRLKIKKSQIVFVYSGGLQKYQMFDETINFFKSIRKTKKDSLLLVLTKEKNEAKKKIIGIRNIRLFSLDQFDVNNYLNAADFAIMIRKNDLTNEAASPTKFAEYCLAGLDVITNSAVKDYYVMKKDIKNIHNVDTFNLNVIKEENRNKVAEFYKAKISREIYIKSYREIYE